MDVCVCVCVYGGGGDIETVALNRGASAQI